MIVLGEPNVNRAKSKKPKNLDGQSDLARVRGHRRRRIRAGKRRLQIYLENTSTGGLSEAEKRKKNKRGKERTKKAGEKGVNRYPVFWETESRLANDGGKVAPRPWGPRVQCGNRGLITE